METVTVKITERDLDSDERRTSERDVEAPGSQAEQRNGLIAAVRSVSPDARIRSFADGVATFIDRQHLVIASYTELPKGRVAPAAADGQARLFDEAA